MIAVDEVQKEKKMFVHRFFLGLALFVIVLNLLKLVPDTAAQTAFTYLDTVLGVIILISWIRLIVIGNDSLSVVILNILSEKERAGYFVYYWFHVITEGFMLLVVGYLIYQKF
ncbi:MAG: hypothetical protein RL097_187 [Candidatus Parcubacteria bacterium]|jgi:hypothetical protein